MIMALQLLSVFAVDAVVVVSNDCRVRDYTALVVSSTALLLVFMLMHYCYW